MEKQEFDHVFSSLQIGDSLNLTFDNKDSSCLDTRIARTGDDRFKVERIGADGKTIECRQEMTREWILDAITVNFLKDRKI